MVDSQVLTMILIIMIMFFMIIFEVLRIDLLAILCMLVLAWTGILDTSEALSGFSSNAVVAMMAVMIMGHGVAKTGVIERFFYKFVFRRESTGRKGILGWTSLMIGTLSGFFQNIGAASLFLPAVIAISRRKKIPASAVIMPVGFAAILGGTLSMVGSGSLIMVNDLLQNASFEPYGLFSVTPVGIILLLTGVAFFVMFGKFLLPSVQPKDVKLSEQEKMIEAFHLPSRIYHYEIPPTSNLIDKTAEGSGLWKKYRLNILGISKGREVIYAPWRETRFKPGQELALLGNEECIKRYSEDYGLISEDSSERLASLGDPEQSGFAELIIPPRSDLIGQSIRQISFRRRYEVEPVMMFSKGEKVEGDFSDHQVLVGDTLIVYGLWDKIAELKNNTELVVATSGDVDRKDYSKSGLAVSCFILAIILALLRTPISLAFFTGAVIMVLTGVLKLQEAYQAIEWKVIFLLAGLIPLGIAMQKTGTASFLAEGLMKLVHDKHIVFTLLTIGAISTLFSLFMSNIGAIVVLAPLVISMAALSGLDARPLVLLAAVCTSNSFILPTHQVNALMMSSGGYKNQDYIKAGSGLTLLFLIIVVSVFYFFYI